MKTIVLIAGHELRSHLKLLLASIASVYGLKILGIYNFFNRHSAMHETVFQRPPGPMAATGSSCIFGIGFLLALYLASTTMTSEKNRDTYNFYLTGPFPRWFLFSGKLMGIFLCMGVFLILSNLAQTPGVFGSVGWYLICLGHMFSNPANTLNWVSWLVMIFATGLLCSTVFATGTGSFIASGLILIGASIFAGSFSEGPTLAIVVLCLAFLAGTFVLIRRGDVVNFRRLVMKQILVVVLASAAATGAIMGLKEYRDRTFVLTSNDAISGNILQTSGGILVSRSRDEGFFERNTQKSASGLMLFDRDGNWKPLGTRNTRVESASPAFPLVMASRNKGLFKTTKEQFLLGQDGMETQLDLFPGEKTGFMGSIPTGIYRESNIFWGPDKEIYSFRMAKKNERKTPMTRRELLTLSNSNPDDLRIEYEIYRYFNGVNEKIGTFSRKVMERELFSVIRPCSGGRILLPDHDHNRRMIKTADPGKVVEPEKWALFGAGCPPEGTEIENLRGYSLLCGVSRSEAPGHVMAEKDGARFIISLTDFSIRPYSAYPLKEKKDKGSTPEEKSGDIEKKFKPGEGIIHWVNNDIAASAWFVPPATDNSNRKTADHEGGEEERTPPVVVQWVFQDASNCLTGEAAIDIADFDSKNLRSRNSKGFDKLLISPDGNLLLIVKHSTSIRNTPANQDLLDEWETIERETPPAMLPELGNNFVARIDILRKIWAIDMQSRSPEPRVIFEQTKTTSRDDKNINVSGYAFGDDGWKPDFVWRGPAEICFADVSDLVTVNAENGEVKYR